MFFYFILGDRSNRPRQFKNLNLTDKGNLPNDHFERSERPSKNDKQHSLDQKEIEEKKNRRNREDRPMNSESSSFR